MEKLIYRPPFKSQGSPVSDMESCQRRTVLKDRSTAGQQTDRCPRRSGISEAKLKQPWQGLRRRADGRAKKKESRVIQKISRSLWVKSHGNGCFLLVGTCLSDTRIFSALGIDRVSASCPWVAEDCQHCLGINPCTRWTLYPYAVARLKA